MSPRSWSNSLARVLALLARWRVMLWPAALALLALAAASISPRPYDDGGLGSLTFGIIHTLGIPFVGAAKFVARQLGPGRGELIWPLAVPLGLVYFAVADWVVQRFARRRPRARPVSI
jgi:hypothetical protein